ncbi:MAG TPA: hypothetical protein VGA68_00905, partial [Woeseiaceae bacterium]
PDVYFEDVEGSAENFDRLFALTEASHCGFIARELANPTVVPPGLSQRELRTILEALGDFEATAVFRSATRDSRGADEADVLFAGRLLAMFLLQRENPYTPLPGLLHEYERIGIDAAHRQMDRITASVRLARHTVREALGASSAFSDTLPLQAVSARLDEAHASGELDVDDALASELIAGLGPAIRLIQGDRTHASVPRRAPLAGGSGPPRLVTLSGASILN